MPRTEEQLKERLRFCNDKIRRLEKALRELGLAIKAGNLNHMQAMYDIRKALETPRKDLHGKRNERI